MATYSIGLYPAAMWNEETETWDLGDRSETIATFDAPHPAAARLAAETHADATGIDTVTVRRRGKPETSRE